jgi:hypothetical protein
LKTNLKSPTIRGHNGLKSKFGSVKIFLPKLLE